MANNSQRTANLDPMLLERFGAVVARSRGQVRQALLDKVHSCFGSILQDRQQSQDGRLTQQSFDTWILHLKAHGVLFTGQEWSDCTADILDLVDTISALPEIRANYELWWKPHAFSIAEWSPAHSDALNDRIAKIVVSLEALKPPPATGDESRHWDGSIDVCAIEGETLGAGVRASELRNALISSGTVNADAGQ